MKNKEIEGPAQLTHWQAMARAGNFHINRDAKKNRGREQLISLISPIEERGGLLLCESVQSV